MNTKAIGNDAEDAAAAYFERIGAEVVERNYRFRRAEIDMIAILNNDLLVFVEVKYRRSNTFGEAETFVSDHQRNKIKMAANNYIVGINWQKDIRFDIISVDAKMHIEHFKDAFY